MPLGPEGRLLDGTHVLGHFSPTGPSVQRQPHHNDLLFLAKGLETQRWPGLCNLFISSQRRAHCESSFMEDGQRKLGREANTLQKANKTNKLRSPCFGVGAGAGGMKLWGLPGGSGPGRRPALPLRLLPIPHGPAWVSLPEPPARSALAIRPAPWERRWRVRKTRARQQEGEDWPPGAAPAVCSCPALAPTPPPQTGVQGSPGPRGRSPHRRRLLPHSSHRVGWARTLGFSVRFACDLHTSATTPPPPHRSERLQVKECETK